MLRKEEQFHSPFKLQLTLINRLNFLGAPALAGFWQYYTETHSITGLKPGPFNFIEEFTEGSLPAVLGGVAMLGLYRKFIDKIDIDPKTKTHAEVYVYGLGAVLGYMAMMEVLGDTIHQTLGVTDVKWGPFK